MNQRQQLEAQWRTLCAQAQAAQADPSRAAQALHLWQEALALDLDNAAVLKSLGQHAFRIGELGIARTALQRAVELNDKDCQQWVNLAVACQMAQDESAEEAAILGALRADPTDLLALLLRANLLERQGRMQQAAKAYTAVLAVSPPLNRLDPELRPAIQQALAFKDRFDRDFGEFINRHLEPSLKLFAGRDLERFRTSLDIMLGRKKRYTSQPAVYFYPQLQSIEFFDRSALRWLDAVEAATDDIRLEFLDILRTEVGFTPYLNYPDDVPHHQFAELNNSPQWSAFHIYEKGELVAANATKCPVTIQALFACPQPDQAGRTPTAMFSLLQPHTHIPPHTGVTNARLVTHLPLIIPPDCGFRVGNDTRAWEEGKAWVFDDTIEHEAWNRSDRLRVVLIFDIWHPGLTPPERAMISAMAEAMNAFSGDAAGFEL